MRHPIVSEELELLEQVLRALDEREADTGPSEQPIVRELERIRELLVSGHEAKDHPELLDQWQNATALLQQLRRSRRVPQVERSSPYFAHMRLREGEKERDLCLGRATCIRDRVRIVDWRNAPVSRIFYRYQQGDPYEERFGGRTVEGEVVARRTVTIRASKLDRVEAPEGTFVRDGGMPGGWRRASEEPHRLAGGEGVALRAHRAGEGAMRRLGTDPSGRRRRVDKRLPDIAGLLDPTQFELISRNGPGVLVVRGGAGSGKTTVALHRVAYLAYGDPQLDSPRTLFLTFSPALRDYAAHVLPALGVQRVRLRTFEEWAAAQRGRHYPALPRGSRPDTPSVVRRAKLHPAMGVALAEQVRRVAGPPARDQALDDWASVLTNASLLEETFDRLAPEALGRGGVQQVVDWSRRRNEELFAWLEGDREFAMRLDAEDDALLLRAWQLRVGPLLGDRRPLVYRHLAVDEVQEFSPVELRVALDCLEPPFSVTLAGDAQQQVAEDAGFGSWEQLLRELEIRDAETTKLRVSYRSSQEIMSFARGVLGPLWEDDSPPRATRSGPPVEVFGFTDHGACVAVLADALRQLASDEPLASVAVLAPSRGVTALYHQGLEHSEVPRLSRVTHYDFRFAPGVEVAEIEQAKGLEFDYVVLVDVSAESFPETSRARRLLHVGATRAVHQLWVMSVGKPSPLLEAAPAA